MMYTFAGTSDEITTCEHCGKSNLKRTVALKQDGGDVVFFGVDCAARALTKAGTKTSSKEVTIKAQAVTYAQALVERYTLQQVAKAVWNRYGFSTIVKDDVLHIGSFAQVQGV